MIIFISVVLIGGRLWFSVLVVLIIEKVVRFIVLVYLISWFFY